MPSRLDKWWADPLSWAELFALSNLAFLAADVGLAHAINAFAHRAEYAPVAFSVVAPAVLAACMAVAGMRPSPGDRGTRVARWAGLVVGGCSIAVGVAGLLFHLDSAFFEEQTLKNLVYTAPFAAPLAYAGLGLLLVLDRMVDARSVEWARWVAVLALGGFVGNFVLTLSDHAQNGFFRPAEWVGVVAAAWAVSTLVAVLVVPDNRPLLILALAVMAAEAGVGVLGSALHAAADLQAPTRSLWDRFVYGSPVFAPMLFADLALLAIIALRALDQARALPAGGETGLGK